jgi:hypothetical protein
MKMKDARSKSLLGLVALGVLFLFVSFNLWCQTTPENKPDTIILVDGTPVHLVLMDDLQGKQLTVKQTVHFKVREDLVVGPQLIVKTGADAFGHIESVSKSGLFGKSGKLFVQFDYVESIAGIKIPLRGGAGVTGGKGGALTWESAMWYGPNANLPVGTVINAYVDRDQRIQVP